MSALLQQAVASGQVSAAQIQAHLEAGELGKSVALQMPPLPGPDWATNTTGINGLQYWTAKSMQAYAQAYAAQQVAGLAAQLAEAKDTLEFVERWANHHAAKPGMTAQEALSCIQHYLAIVAITRAYSNGKVPETRNPWAELEAVRAAQLREVAHLKQLLSRYRNEIPAGHQPYMICHEVDAALNTKDTK